MPDTKTIVADTLRTMMGATAAEPYVKAIDKAISADDDERAIRDVVCPQCKRPFRLTWNDYRRISDSEYAKQTLFISSCPSCGIYDVKIECPYCDYSEAL